MIRHYYHATDLKNLESIKEKGLLKNAWGVIFLCERPEDCLKFMGVHLTVNVAVLQVTLDESEVTESFDHNEKFFKCKAYTADRDIHNKDIISIQEYSLVTIGQYRRVK